MITVPKPTPVTSPDPSILPIAVLLLLHMPPAVASLNVIVEPKHIEVVPKIGPATGLTTIN